jgi:hypothetical protein
MLLSSHPSYGHRGLGTATTRFKRKSGLVHNWAKNEPLQQQTVLMGGEGARILLGGEGIRILLGGDGSCWVVRGIGFCWVVTGIGFCWMVRGIGFCWWLRE